MRLCLHRRGPGKPSIGPGPGKRSGGCKCVLPRQLKQDATAGRKPCTTVQLSTQFISPARIGDFVEGRAEVLRATRTVVFVRGLLTVGDRTVVSAEGVWKILGA